MVIVLLSLYIGDFQTVSGFPGCSSNNNGIVKCTYHSILAFSAEKVFYFDRAHTETAKKKTGATKMGCRFFLLGFLYWGNRIGLL